MQMVRSLEEMASVGAAKMRRKAAIMSRNWEASKGRMKTNYGKLPFGPNTKAAYAAGVDAGRHRVDVEKWVTNWKAGVSR